ncbi:MAG TPA: GNAT family protein [Hyphomonadaceae bacterium]|jgi:RimJ/RimL family protein N-acetyltransferase|nr:GNAT family protein [Hyphomonadaceae bacterium]HPI50466.1 GNAT family protein [Hyphomonadaceae bacterium]
MPADFITRPTDPVADGPALHAIFGDEESCRFLSRPATASIADTIAMMQEWASGDDINWVLADHIDGPALARVSVYPRGQNNIWEAACMVAPAARGRNLAVRGLALALEEAFEHRGARRIMADVDPDNTASARVFEKLGFQLEGRLRGEWDVHIGIRDSLIFGLLRDDPRPWRNWSL